jgi:hypothetical protein
MPRNAVEPGRRYRELRRGVFGSSVGDEWIVEGVKTTASASDMRASSAPQISPAGRRYRCARSPTRHGSRRYSER